MATSQPTTAVMPNSLARRRRILIVDPIHEAATATLSLLFDVTTRLQPPEDELAELIPEADAIVLRSGVRLTASTIAAATNLKVIARAGVGVDNIDIEAARQKGITVFNVPAVSGVAVAEFAIGLILAVARHIPLADAELRKGQWNKTAHVGMELRGRTLGLVGLGSIGSRIATLATAFGMHILTCVQHISEDRRTKLDEQGIHLVALENLLRAADVICIAVPLTASTRELIAAKQLAWMQPSAYLVNLSRGQVINEHDLYTVLSQQKIAGAALDVTVGEGRGTPLTRLKNVVLTPHIAAMTTASQERIGETVVQSIVAALDGRRVENQVC